MNLLLDTHSFLWWIDDSPKLSSGARELMGAGVNRLLWSAASSWEVAIKYALGRLKLPQKPIDFLPKHLKANRVESLPVTDSHALEAGALPRHHADPFDRMLIAQARREELVLLSVDPDIRRYDVDVRW